MKVILVLLVLINPLNDLDKIARVNAAKKEAEQAYLAQNYDVAMGKYLYLKDSLGVQDDRLALNLANAQFYSNDSTGALKGYQNLVNSSDKQIASLANQQLGAMQFRSKKYQEALQYYKSSLKSNPANDDARYNYELLKKLIKEQEEEQQDQDQQNQDQQNQDQENKDQEKQDQENQDQENQNKEEQQQNEEQEEQQQEQEQQQEEQEQKQDEQQQEEKSEEQKEQEKEDESKPNPIDEEKLKEMKISEEKAMLILEAMKNNEIQYIQQNKRKQKKKKDPSKPDW